MSNGVLFVLAGVKLNKCANWHVHKAFIGKKIVKHNPSLYMQKVKNKYSGFLQNKIFDG